MSKRAVTADNAPKAIGPYSQGISAGDFVFVSGQTPLEPATGNLINGDIRAQTERVLNNVQAVLEAAGLDFSRVVKTNVYLKNMSDFAAMNEVYAKFFKEPYPARATIGVAELPKNALVEIEAIAIR
ncbi:MAG: RidA family protein [Elusimicrobia bacterium]|nr:RidA family protein [Elusimicrobiota bacterium]